MFQPPVRLILITTAISLIWIDQNTGMREFSDYLEECATDSSPWLYYRITDLHAQLHGKEGQAAETAVDVFSPSILYLGNYIIIYIKI